MTARPFTDTLRELRYGEALEELTDKLHQLVQAVSEHHKPGDLTLKISIKPGNGGAVEVVDTIGMKLPEAEKGSSLFFVTPENNLSRKDPRQREMSLAPVVARAVHKEDDEAQGVSNG